MKRLSIQTISFLLIILLSAVSIGQGIISIYSSNNSIKTLEELKKAQSPFKLGAVMRKDLLEVRNSEGAMIFQKTEDGKRSSLGIREKSIAEFNESLEKIQSAPLPPEARPALDKAVSTWNELLQKSQTTIDLALAGRGEEAGDHYIKVTRPIKNAGVKQLTDFIKIIEQDMEKKQQIAAANSKFSVLVSTTCLIIATIVAIFSLFYFRTELIIPIIKINESLRALSKRQTQLDIHGKDRTDELGEMARAVESLRQVSIDAFRSEAAVKDGSVPFLIADADLTITTVNRAFETLLNARRDALSKHLSLPRSEALVGQKLHCLYAQGDSQAHGLQDLSQPRNSQITLGDLVFDQTVWPVRGTNGERLGTVVQWVDKTEEIGAQREIERLVNAASDGDFSQQIPTEGKAGFFKALTHGLNTVTHTVEAGLKEANRTLSAMARGDVTVRFEGEYKGEFHQLQTSANSTAETLSGIATRISAACDSVLLSTQEIHIGATDLSERTEQQAASLQETAASMEELATTVRHSAANARDASTMSQSAETAAEHGGGIVANAVTAMSRIEDSAGKISDIVNLIEEIAFQTNLLALNAAVEAARAGEAGKGFAVVATEVRALAQRASMASREIKTLIDASNHEVRDGVSLVRSAGESLEGIVTSVRKAARVISEISSAAGEQSAGLDEVNKAVSQLDQITQQNAALVEETTAALDSTRSQIEELSSLISFFQTSGAGSVVPLPIRASNQGRSETHDRGADKTKAKPRTVAARRPAPSRTALAYEDANDWKEF